MLQITRFVFNPFQENTYLLYDDVSLDAIVVDAGMYYKEESEAIDKFIADNRLHLVMAISTHMHLDHCFGVEYLKEKYNVKLAANSADKELGYALPMQCRRFGINSIECGLSIDRALCNGDEIKLGGSTLKVIHLPGHSPGGIALYCAEQKFVIVGDSLFKGSIGRTDLDGGDHAALISSIKSGLMSLPDDTTVLSGHGEPTTIGFERRNNPYIR